MKKINTTILVDNTPDPLGRLHSEHGLSIYIEFDGLKLLFDVGASDKFLLNAKMLGIDIGDVDYLILSHGHFDHTGGLSHFIGANKKAKVIVSPHVLNRSLYSYRYQSKRDLSIKQTVLEQSWRRLMLVEENQCITSDITIVTNLKGNFARPKGNSTLFIANGQDEKLDPFDHEIALAINTPNGVAIFSGCSHNGILNILDACSMAYPNSKIAACIGGTHLVNSMEHYSFETDVEVASIGKMISDQYPEMQLITGHCTGSNAQRILAEILGDRFISFYSGLSI